MTTVGSPGGIALYFDGGIQGVDLERDSIRYSRTLLKQVRDLLGEHDRSVADLTGVAVCTGPGSFTGIRVGMAVARALSFSLEIPLVGVTAHEALRAACHPQESSLAVTLDARRDEVYAISYAPGAEKPDGPVKTLSVEETGAWLSALSQQNPVRVVGDAVPRYIKAWEGCPGVQFAVAGEHEVRPEHIAIQGSRGLVGTDASNWLSVSPVYVRRSDSALGLGQKKTPGVS